VLKFDRNAYIFDFATKSSVRLADVMFAYNFMG